MAKKAILEVLESTIGRYVRNLDAESLNVAVWSGKIELQSLQLDTVAVNSELSRRAHEAPNLACPFRVLEGRFEKVQLDVPWARLSSRPVVFRAKGLHVWMEPHEFLKEEGRTSGWGERRGKKKLPQHVKSAKSKAMEERSNSIARAEAARKRANAVRMALEDGADSSTDDGDDVDGDSAKNSSTFTSRLVRRIVENLQFEIEDVHVAVRGCGCAAGVVLGSLSLVTTDAMGNRTFVDRQANVKNPASSFLYKELLISGLGIYLQSDNASNPHGDSLQRMDSLKSAEGREYVLSPLSFQAKLRQSDLDHCVDFPKYLIHSKLSSLSIQLTRPQLELGHRLALAVAPNAEVRPLFPEYRPLEPISGNAKQWWRYAVRCIGRLNRHRSWIEFFIAFQKRKTYLELYKRDAHAEGAQWLTKLKAPERAELEKIEGDRSISIAGLMHWRTIADAQVEKEREKHKIAVLKQKLESGSLSTPSKPKPMGRSSLATSLFGSAPRKDSSDEFYECLDDENDAPISLTVDEMKELEELAFKKADAQLSKDSMLCDINFTLGSFQVNLVKSTLQPLTSLEMGMVSTSFKANADGSFAFGLSLLSLEVLDSVTRNTFYPTICRSLQKAQTTKSHAFRLELKKTREGDQELVLKMVACEIVASPLLLFEVKEFFKLPVPFKAGNGNGNNRGKSNPILLESTSGEEDLFYDASEGGSTMLLSPLGIGTSSAAQLDFSVPALHQQAVAIAKDGKVSDKLSSAIVDAWNGKNQKKQKWAIDMDISAPILVLPENCIDPRATVLICNFGRFNFTYGNEGLSQLVTEWFNEHQRANKQDSEIDHLKLEMNNLSFTISSVGEATTKGLDGLNLDVSNSVIQPVSFTLDIGLEHTISSDDSTPRTCIKGVLPGIMMRLGPSHVNKVLRVAAVWSSNLHKLRGDLPSTEGDSILPCLPEEPTDLEIMSSGSGISILDAASPEKEVMPVSQSNTDRIESMLLSRRSERDILSSSITAAEYVHISVSLLRLSINIYTDNGDGIEAHLVSVVASSSLYTDGSSSNRLRMGWFWILDQLESEHKLPRRQRLVCHSNLPRSAPVYSENENYSAIMEDLTKQGVFKSNYIGSADLADIHITKLPNTKALAYHEQVTEFSRQYISTIKLVDKATVINAKFTSLFINWNPPAVKTLFMAKSNLLDFKEKAYSTYEQMAEHRASTRASVVPKAEKVPRNEEVHSIFILAQMETFEMSLNSAKDDMPLFSLTMCDSKVNHHSVEGDDENSEMIFVLGDFRLETPNCGKTMRSYQTLLGLAPSASTSLLTVKYCKGSQSVQSCNVGGANKSNCEACAEVLLSPMRFVHIHSQVFTLIEYVTEGVLGAMTASAASSAAAAAREVAKSSQSGEKLFYIVATGFDFVLPQGAYHKDHFSFHAGKLEAHYRSLASDVGSEAEVSLTELSMQCAQKMSMVSIPINMSISLKMKPPFAPLTEDERATRVDVSISRIQILIARCHYAQIMRTLEYNIGEQDNFLRAENSFQYNRSSSLPEENAQIEAQSGVAVDSLLKNLSHAGVENVEVIKRMYINFNIQELSVELCGLTTEDPIMSVAAVKAHILMKLLPDENQTKAFVALHDLVCDDLRLGSTDRTFRRMIGRASNNHTNAVSRAKLAPNDSEVFLLNYTKNGIDDSREIEVKIGSSVVIVLPDVITEILNFINVTPIQVAATSSFRQKPVFSEMTKSESLHVVVKDDGPEEFETCFESTKSDSAVSVKKTKYLVESSNMRLVLVDLGSMDSSGPFVSTKSSSALTETIVLQGKMKANFEMTSNIASNDNVEKDYKIDAERVEIYTAKGASLQHPVSILEPAKFSIFYYQKSGEVHLTDLKFVTLTPIDLTISMQNAALASALATSISDSFSTNKETSADEAERHSISAREARRIARLDSELERVEDIDEPMTPSEHSTDVSVHAGQQIEQMRKLTRLKMTSPEVILTLTNDFQGLDEALFKVIAMNWVFGGELDYPGASASEKPCFGFNMNTSFLADYFDTASNRWENFLTSPWEITLNGSRGPQSRFHSKRMSSTFDIESNPCHISFSEHFLVSAGAASRMWSVYSGATKQATHLVEEKVKDDLSKRRLSRSMAAHAARSLITTLPYAIENHSGINAMYSIYDDPTQHPLRKSSTQFFQFELFPERGTGGVRKYGQDVKHKKSLTIYIGKTEISIDDMDSEVQKPRSAHYISDYKTHVFTSVVKRGNSTVLHLSSHVEMYNSSSLPFRIAVLGDDKVHDLGIVKVAPKTTAVDGSGGKSLLKESEELMTHSKFGLPAPLLTSFMIDTSETLCLQISPVLKETNDFELAGMFNLPPLDRLVEIATSPQGEAKRVIEVSCSPSTRARNLSSLVANVCCKVTLVDSAHPFVQLFIEPRVVMTNRLPVSVLLRTPMPHTLVSSNSDSGEEYLEHADDSKYTTHELAPKESVEVFTPGPSIAISLTCADVPIGGTAIGWIEGGWLDIPLGKNKKILEPLNCTFPFETKSLDSYPSSRKTTSVGSGSEFFVLEADDVTPDLKQTVTRTSGSSDSCRTVVIMVCNYVVDHIGNILFEEVAPSDNTARRTSSNRSSINSSFLDSSPPFSAFSSRLHRRRVSLLPRSSNLIRLVQLTMDGDEGMKRSIPFRIEDVSMTEGIDAMPILWMDTTPTGFFVYRHLTTEGSELHVVPEYVVFNGSNEVIVVKQLSKNPFSLDSSKIYPIERDRNNSIVVQFDIPSLNALTGPVQIDKVGLRICVARSKSTGEALGSLAVQTVIGARDSRLVIKIGAFNAGEDQSTESSVSSSLFEHDFIRFRVRWSEMRVTLKDTSFGENEKYEENRAAIRKYLEHHNINSSEVEQRLAEVRKDYNKMIDKKRDVFPEVAQILLHRFTVDFQRIFKDNEPKSKGVLSSNERSQFSVVIHNVRITDCSPNTSSSVVFDSMSEKSFFDLCVRTRGPLNADLIRVDLVDLNLAYGDGKAEKIVVNTGEDFVWRLLDIANRTMLETANLAGVDLSLKWDESAGKFSVSISDPMGNSGDDVDLDGKYCPPRSDKLYDVKKLRVSPFLLLLSFKRQPQSSRYKLIRGVRGAKLANYFTTRLKFTIDRAELRFQGYMARDIKGPPDRLADTIKTVYATQLKTKMIALMTATSFQDWKYLTARDSGGEEFIEGDLLRMTGNLTGRSAKYVLKKLGDGIGDSVVAMTGTIGGGIQDATESIGIGYVGAGVNSLISGVGEGVGSTVKGVGTGAGDILRGAGKGIGQAFGGIGGGVQQVTKGIGRGVTHGDLSGVGEGFASMGNGLGQGVETVVDGTVSGVLSVSKGLFSGAKSVGKGVGGFFTGGRDVGGKTPPKGPPKQR